MPGRSSGLARMVGKKGKKKRKKKKKQNQPQKKKCPVTFGKGSDDFSLPVALPLRQWAPACGIEDWHIYLFLYIKKHSQEKKSQTNRGF
jgi:hypothetical protein